jgi:hypothetical protein
MPWQMIPRLLCECIFLSFYLRSSLMVGADTRKINRRTPPCRALSLSSVTIVAYIAKEQQQIGNITLTVRAQLQKYYKHARRAVPYGARCGSFRCRDKCVFCARWLKKRKSHARGCKAVGAACAKITHASRSKEIHPFPETKQRTLPLALIKMSFILFPQLCVP